MLRGADAVSIGLVVQGSAVTSAASSQISIEADLVQYRYNEGPCIVTAQVRHPVRIDVLRQDEEVEHFAPGAVEIGVESVLSVPLLWAGDAVGSINLYSFDQKAFSHLANVRNRRFASDMATCATSGEVG